MSVMTTAKVRHSEFKPYFVFRHEKAHTKNVIPPLLLREFKKLSSEKTFCLTIHHLSVFLAVPRM